MPSESLCVNCGENLVDSIKVLATAFGPICSTCSNNRPSIPEPVPIVLTDFDVCAIVGNSFMALSVAP